VLAHSPLAASLAGIGFLVPIDVAVGLGHQEIHVAVAIEIGRRGPSRVELTFADDVVLFARISIPTQEPILECDNVGQVIAIDVGDIRELGIGVVGHIRPFEWHLAKKLHQRAV